MGLLRPAYSRCPAKVKEPAGAPFFLRNPANLPQNGTVNTKGYPSPDGKANAATFTEDTSNNSHYITGPTNVAVTVELCTQTVWIKRTIGVRNVYAIYANTAFTNLCAVGIDLKTGLVVSALTGTATNKSYKAIPVGNGWWKISITFTAAIDTGGYWAYNCISGSTLNFVGDGASGLAFWGLDFRVGAGV